MKRLEREELVALFSALGAALDDPAEALVRRDMDNPLLCALARPAVRATGSGLSDSFDALWDALEELPVLTLRVEYTRLFLGPQAPRLQPYEHALGGRAPGGGSVLTSYSQEGFGISPEFKDRPDHVCIELEFLAHLLDSDRVDQAAEFSQAHLSPLLAYLAPRLRTETRLAFYRIVADVLSALAQSDVLRLKSPGAATRN